MAALTIAALMLFGNLSTCMLGTSSHVNVKPLCKITSQKDEVLCISI